MSIVNLKNIITFKISLSPVYSFSFTGKENINFREFFEITVNFFSNFLFYRKVLKCYYSKFYIFI